MKAKLDLLFVFLISIIISISQKNDYELKTILRVANSELNKSSGKIPKGFESNYGFNKRDEYTVEKIVKLDQLIH